jgi:dienelactone hydrolase
LPEEAYHLYYWQVCLASRTNQTEWALDHLAEALDVGHWYNERQLRQDEDLKPLQGLPRFEALVSQCLERQAAAQAQAAPRLLTLEPAGISPTGSIPWLLALHGNNSQAETAAEQWRPAASLGWLVALPGSSQVTGPNRYGWNDWERAKGEIQSHVTVLLERHPLDQERGVVGGFSMGGGLAAWLALSGVIRVRGFILVGAFVPDMEQLVGSMETHAAHKLRGYIIVGEEDDECYAISPALAEHLKVHGIPCELEVHPKLAHDFPPDFEKSLARALEYISP